MSNFPGSPSLPPASLRLQGIAALRAGDSATARHLLVLALGENPDDLEAWLWLSGAVSSDGERRFCLLRVQALSPGHPAATRGLALLPDVEPVSPLPQMAPPAPAPELALPVPVEVLKPRPETIPLPTPAPPSSLPSPGRPSWLFWGAVGGLSLVLVLLVSFVALRITRDGRAAGVSVVAIASAPSSPGGRTAAPSSASPTASTAVIPEDRSAPALAARGLVRERRDDDPEGALADYTAAISLDPSYADAYYSSSENESARLQGRKTPFPQGRVP